MARLLIAIAMTVALASGRSFEEIALERAAQDRRPEPASRVWGPTRLRCRSAAQLSPNRCRRLTDREMRYSAAAAWVRVNSLTASKSV
jgi:hypothetical protein